VGLQSTASLVTIRLTVLPDYFPDCATLDSRALRRSYDRQIPSTPRKFNTAISAVGSRSKSLRQTPDGDYGLGRCRREELRWHVPENASQNGDP
jgi:hypothetical protein